MIPMVRRNRLTERYLDIVTEGGSFPISQPFPNLFGNDGKSASAGKRKKNRIELILNTCIGIIAVSLMTYALLDRKEKNHCDMLTSVFFNFPSFINVEGSAFLVLTIFLCNSHSIFNLESASISREKMFSLPDGQQLFFLVFMLHSRNMYELSEDDTHFFEKYILSWFHSCGFNLPLIGKYLMQYGTASVWFPQRQMFRSEILPLLGYVEGEIGNSESLPVDDLNLLQNLHVIGLTLFDLQSFFPIDFSIKRAGNNDEECSDVDDAPESDPTHIAEILWNDLEDSLQSAIQTRSDQWDEKKVRAARILLVQLKVGNSATILAAPNGLTERFVIWGSTNHRCQDRFLDMEIFPIIDAWKAYCQESKTHKRNPEQQRPIPKSLFQYLRMTVPADKTRTISDV
jgi:hypothetical protein